jgi:hypothetical protein
MTIWDKLSKLIPKHLESMKKISFTNLYEVARMADLLNEAKLIDLMSQAETCTQRGFKDNIKEIEGKTPTDVCDHVNKKRIIVCKRCGKALLTEDVVED